MELDENIELLEMLSGWQDFERDESLGKVCTRGEVFVAQTELIYEHCPKGPGGLGPVDAECESYASLILNGWPAPPNLDLTV